MDVQIKKLRSRRRTGLCTPIYVAEHATRRAILRESSSFLTSCIGEETRVSPGPSSSSQERANMIPPMAIEQSKHSFLSPSENKKKKAGVSRYYNTVRQTSTTVAPLARQPLGHPTYLQKMAGITGSVSM